jgi:DNA-binding response OmpR family regulator
MDGVGLGTADHAGRARSRQDGRMMAGAPGVRHQGGDVAVTPAASPACPAPDPAAVPRGTQPWGVGIVSTTPPSRTVLVVEDDAERRTALTQACRAAGHAITEAQSGSEALDAVGRELPDLVVLPVRLPDISGVDVCRRMRRNRFTGQVLMLGADLVDVVVSLEVGADDCLRTPYHPLELVARVGSRLRRSVMCRQPSPPEAQVLQRGELIVDCRHRRTFLGRREVTLRSTEFDLLARLAERPGAVVSRDDLVRSLAGGSRRTQLRTVDSHVYRLRRRLQAVDPGGRYIETVHGAGYRLVEAAPGPGADPRRPEPPRAPPRRRRLGSLR